MNDPRLNALIILVDSELPCLDVEERKKFMKELRCGWCENCGRTENKMCRERTCST